MKIKVCVVEFETPKRIRKTLAYAAPLLIVLGAGAVWAAPVQWTSMETLTATKMNAITVVTNGNVRYSVGATLYCGQTAASYDGAGVGGYAGAKTKCEAVAGCANSLSAHQCTAEELIRSEALGVNVPTSQRWFASGVWAWYESQNVNDCQGFTSAAFVDLATLWENHHVSVDHCSVSYPIACCD